MNWIFVITLRDMASMLALATLALIFFVAWFLDKRAERRRRKK